MIAMYAARSGTDSEVYAVSPFQTSLRGRSPYALNVLFGWLAETVG
jgi:hypothetical protein